MKPGPRTREQLARLGREWKQGEHVLITGATGSGKTALARHINQIRINNGGHVLTLVCKFQNDPTIVQDYAGWTRWEKMKKNPSRHDNRILLWPDLHKEKTIPAKRAKQRDVFRDAFDQLANVGKWTLHVDEGLYICHPSYMGLSDELAILLAMGRSSKLSVEVLAQRPSHLPLLAYSSASHAFMGRARESVDTKRLSELGGKENAKELSARIDSQGRHDYLWLPVAPDWEPEPVNLRL